MHILVTADTLGGVWNYTRELVTGLHARGHRVTLVSFGDIPTAAQTEWITALQNVDFRPTAFRLEWMQDSDADLAAAAAFLLALNEEVDPDMLHFSQFYFGNIPCDIPRIVVAHSDVVTWWQAVHGKQPPPSAWMASYRAAVQRAVRGADVVVAPSNWMLDAFQEVHGTVKRAAVIYNGRTPAWFNPYAAKRGYALSVGRLWDLGKNSVLLSRIASPLPVSVAGSDRDPSGGPDGPLAAGNSALTFKGPQDSRRLQELYANAAIYIATSQYEPFGLAPVEAALSRCAIVASDIPSLAEIWGDAAIYFRNNDALSLQETLDDLVSNPGRVTAAAGRAYRRAMQYYTSSRMVDDYLSLYRSLVPAELSAA
jgi:glycosyltransferase involved in cell wall biosynthesis